MSRILFGTAVALAALLIVGAVGRLSPPAAAWPPALDAVLDVGALQKATDVNKLPKGDLPSSTYE
jgi:hypothetical protein